MTKEIALIKSKNKRYAIHAKKEHQIKKHILERLSDTLIHMIDKIDNLDDQDFMIDDSSGNYTFVLEKDKNTLTLHAVVKKDNIQTI